MALLETREDYQFSEYVEELSRNTSKLAKAAEDVMAENHDLLVAVKRLTEAIEYQNEQFTRFMKDHEDDFYGTENLRPDVVLM